jgi:phosphatidylglycerophosphate synthase
MQPTLTHLTSGPLPIGGRPDCFHAVLLRLRRSDCVRIQFGMTDAAPNNGSKDAGFEPIPPPLPLRPTRLFPLTRQFSWPLTRFLLRTPIGPNQVTALSLLAGLAGAVCFTLGTREAGVTGALLYVLCYTLDNCDGEIARFRNMTSELGARFDDLVDWLVDTAFFAALGYGTWVATGEIIWFWLGFAAAAGATIDFVIDMLALLRTKKEEIAVKPAPAPSTTLATTQDAVPAIVPDGPDGNDDPGQSLTDKLIYVFHTLSRADFCFIIFALTVADLVWILLPFGAIGAQVYWMTDLYKHARRRSA